jgi:hypothetical protein
MEESLREEIKASREAGATDEGIRQALLNAGHSKSDIEAAMSNGLLTKTILFRNLSFLHKTAVVLLFLIFLSLFTLIVYNWVNGGNALLELTKAMEIK